MKRTVEGEKDARREGEWKVEGEEGITGSCREHAVSPEGIDKGERQPNGNRHEL